MITKLFFFCLPVRRNLFLQIQNHFRSNFSVVAESNVSNNNASSQNLFLHFVTTRLNMSSADAAKIQKRVPWLGRLRALDKVEQFVSMLNRHGCNEDQIIKIIKSQPWLLLKSFKPSVAFWEDFGFRGTELPMFLLVNPWVLTRSSLTPEQRDLIRKIGIHKESKMYKYVVNIVAIRRIEVLEARIDNLQICGLLPEEALQVVRVNPLVLTKSEENIKKQMDFMLNHMRLSVDFVAKHPRMFTMSLEKVMRPRFLVLQNMTAMKGEGEVDPRRLFSKLKMTEAKFVAQIIRGHPESVALSTVYRNAIANVSKAQT